jgi:hypothetical protein
MSRIDTFTSQDWHFRFASRLVRFVSAALQRAIDVCIPRGFAVPAAIAGVVQLDVFLKPIRAYRHDPLRLDAMIEQNPKHFGLWLAR